MVTPLSCALPNRKEHGPKGSGDERLKISPGTLLHSIYESQEACEQYFCNYGVNEEYEREFQAAGLRVSARGIHGEPRAVELPGHRFFVAALFQPQLSSRPESPHRLLVEFLVAAGRFGQTRSRKTVAVSPTSRRQLA